MLPANITKNYSVNVIGIIEPSQGSVSSSAEEQNNLSAGNISSPLPPVNENNNTTNTATITTGPESIPSVPITPSSGTRDNEDTTIYWDIQ